MWLHQTKTFGLIIWFWDFSIIFPIRRTRILLWIRMKRKFTPKIEISLKTKPYFSFSSWPTIERPHSSNRFKLNKYFNLQQIIPCTPLRKAFNAFWISINGLKSVQTCRNFILEPTVQISHERDEIIIFSQHPYHGQFNKSKFSFFFCLLYHLNLINWIFMTFFTPRRNLS